MTKIKRKTIKGYIIFAVTLAVIISLLYYISQREITDSYKLARKTSGALSRIDSYRFSMSTVLSTPINNDVLEMMAGRGEVDYKNEKMHTLLTVMERSVENYIIESYMYMKEFNDTSQGEWQGKKLSEDFWEGQIDQLSQQKSILQSARNANIRKDKGLYVLEIIPNKTKVLEQINSLGGGAINEDQLRDYKIIYWINSDFRIEKTETIAEFQMNLQGLETVVKLESTVNMFNYDEEFEIEAPI